ncbi:MAG: bacteriohopanetetrol glucosamine biosynthesis glycosyltransferase HpnI [Janthinobacterium lividum]
MLAPLVALCTTLLTLAGLVYLVLALFAARGFRREPLPPPPATWPTVSVLKPVKGMDPHRYSAFASMCTQVYGGRFELLLGMADPSDQELAGEVERLQAEFPQALIRSVPCPQNLGNNGKVSTLAQMVPHAMGEVLVINDADILAGPHYLSAIASAMAGPNVGFVTVPYLGRTLARPTVWARLEALGIAGDLLPGVFTARMLDRGVRFGLGSTLALRRATLDSIGGMEPLLNRIADDYELGERVDRAGMRVVLAAEVVQTSVPQYNRHDFWQHQVRWWRTVRDARPWSFFGMVVSYALPWAMLNVVACGFALPSLSLLSLVLLARVALLLNVGVGILRDGQVLRDLWLLPMRDTVSLLLWAWSYAGNEVVWRGEHFVLQSGKLTRAAD